MWARRQCVLVSHEFFLLRHSPEYVWLSLWVCVRLRCFLPSCYEANWWVKSPMPHKCQCAQLRWFRNVMEAERQKENQSWARACNISQLKPGVNAIRPTHWNQQKASGWSDLITSDLVCKFGGVENIHLLHILSCYSLKFNFSPQNSTHNAS